MNQQELAQLMKLLGFVVLENEGIWIYVLEMQYYFLVVESIMVNKDLRYSFTKNTYSRGKKETKVLKCYFEGFNQQAMIKRVGSYMAFMLK